MTRVELGKVLATIPNMVSDITFNLMGQNEDKIPRFSSVFKLVKEELKYDGIDFKKLSESEKYDIEEMARDTFDGIKEATITIDKYKLRVAVVQQLENLEELLKDDRYKKYHFIEVMNCKGGCIGGGGQPLCQITQLEKVREQRSKGLYTIDNNRPVRCAHDNKELKILYKNYLKKPLSEDSFKLLHTSYSDKSNLLHDK